MSRGGVSVLKSAVSAIALLVLCGLALPCRADTVSSVVVVLDQEIAGGKTIAIATPSDASGQAESLAEALPRVLGDGDRLHIWLGKIFATYTLFETAWRIETTTTAAPEARLAAAPNVCLVTRLGTASRLVRHVTMPRSAAVSVEVAPLGWTLVAPPFPVFLVRDDLAAAGMGDGDMVRVWSIESGTWETCSREDGGWVPPESEPVIGIGEPFLFFNSDPNAKRLTFGRP